MRYLIVSIAVLSTLFLPFATSTQNDTTNKVIPVTPGPMTTPEPFEFELIKEAEKKKPPDRERIIHTAGPMTRGAKVLIPGANESGFVQLPADAWVSFWGSAECEEGCEGIFVAVRRAGVEDTLWIRQGEVHTREDQSGKMPEIRSRFDDVISKLEKEGSK